MIKRTTWIVLAIFIVLAGAALYLQRSGEGEDIFEPEPTATQEVTNLLDINQSEITGFSIQDQGGQIVVLMKGEGDTWQLTAPVEGEADATKVNPVLRQMESLQVTTALETPPPLDAVGLQEPTYTLTISLADGRQILVLIGDQTATGSGYYAKTGDGPVVVASKFGLDMVIELLQTPPLAPTPTVEDAGGVGSTPTP